MIIRGNSVNNKVCEHCGSVVTSSAEQKFTGDDNYQYFEIHVAGKRIAFHVAKKGGQTDVYFVNGELKLDGNRIHVEVE